MTLALCAWTLHWPTVFAYSISASKANGALSAVEKLSDTDVEMLRKAEVEKISSLRKHSRVSVVSVPAISANHSISRLRSVAAKPKMEHIQHPKLTSLGEVANVVADYPHVADAVADSKFQAASESLAPLSHFDVVNLVIDQRAAELVSLRAYSLWGKLRIDPRVQLVSLADGAAKSAIFVDQPAFVDAQVTPKDSDTETATVEYLTLPEADSSFTKTKVYVRDYQAVLRTQAYYDDNIFASSGRKKGSVVLLNDLEGRATLERGRSALGLRYSIRDGRFASSSDDNFTDGRLVINADQKIGDSQSLRFTVDRYAGHEARGSGVSEGANIASLKHPLAVDRNKIELEHTLGALDSRLRMTNSISHFTLDYEAFPQLTQQREYSQLTYSNLSKYRLGAKTILNVGGSIGEIDYRFDPVPVAGVADSFDADTTTLLLGFDRDIARTTTARVMFGRLARDFVDPDRASTATAYWDAEFLWRPRSYSTMSLGLGRQFLESRGVGDFIDSREYKFAWAHAWAKRLSSQLNFRYSNDDYVGTNREDRRTDLSLRIAYKFNDRISFVSGGRYHQLQSDGTDLDYQRRVLFIESTIRL